MSEKTTGIVSLTKIPADSVWLSAGKITIQVYILPLNPLLTVGG